jgi:hypothetical protein
MGASQRRKGAAGEREVCALLTDALGSRITRNIGQARDGGDDITLAPFAIEVKRRARIGNLYEWLQQAQTANKGIPVVVCRADGEKWCVVMRFDDWIALAREEVIANVADD